MITWLVCALLNSKQYINFVYTTHHLWCADVRDQDKSSPLHLACEGGHKGVVKYLVEEANCDVSE